jgi:hypothetical protein
MTALFLWAWIRSSCLPGERQLWPAEAGYRRDAQATTIHDRPIFDVPVRA